VPLDHYVTLGPSGLRVSPFALGAMTFGEDPGGAGCSVEESEKILDVYADHGGNFVDTANFYTNGHSEKILGDWLAAAPGRRDRVVVASKFFFNLFPGNPNAGGAGRSAIIAQLEESLRRLRTDHIDLYWLHNWDRNTPVEETMRALDDLVRAGKIRYIGFSNVPAWVTAQAQTLALLRGWTPLIALQVEYSLLARSVEGEVAPLAQDRGLALVPWSPLKNGFLSGKYRRSEAVGDSARATFVGQPSEREYDVIEAVAGVAADLGTTSAAVALAWLRTRPGTVVPILGARRLGHLEQNLAGLDVGLSAEQVRTLDDLSRPTSTTPHPCTAPSGRCCSSRARPSTASRRRSTRRCCRATSATEPRARPVEEQAERVAVGIQADPDAVLRLELRDRRPGLDGVRHRGVEVVHPDVQVRHHLLRTVGRRPGGAHVVRRLLERQPGPDLRTQHHPGRPVLHDGPPQERAVEGREGAGIRGLEHGGGEGHRRTLHRSIVPISRW
jgi:aryl-alcohol dehydrogenase-like predicted oxidoreductase